MGQEILLVRRKETQQNNVDRFAQYVSSALALEYNVADFSEDFSINSILEKRDIILIICQLSSQKNQKTEIKQYLKAFREVRMPYVFFKEWHGEVSNIQQIIVPVTFLPEEREKASWSSSFGRSMEAETVLYKPKDKGTRAAKNVSFIQSILKKKSLPVEVKKSLKSSEKIDKSVARAYNKPGGAVLLIISASRDYGLDDVIFGPREQHVIKCTCNPVLVINPRDDIYVLCGD